MKKNASTHLKILMIAGLAVAPFGVIHGQVIAPDETVRPAVSVKVEGSPAGDKKSEKRDESGSEGNRNENRNPKKAIAGKSGKEEIQKPPSRIENKRTDKMRDIAKKASERAIDTKRPDAPVSRPVPKPAREPRTSQEIANEAAKQAVRKANPIRPVPEREKPLVNTENKGKGRNEETRKPSETSAERMIPKKSVPQSPQESDRENGKGRPGVVPVAVEPQSNKTVRSKPVPIPVEEEKRVVETTQKVDKEVNREKLSIKTPAQAEDMIRKIIGADSEMALTEKRRDQEALRKPEVRRSDSDRSDRSNDHNPPREAVVSYLLKRFQGNADIGDAPAEFRREQRFGGDHRDERDFDRDQHHHHPIYNGRRHVQYRNRSDVPAILLAAVALNRVHMQNYSEVTYLPPYLPVSERPRFENQPLSVVDIPRDYRDPNSYVVSYDVDPDSMVSRDDILFQQGSTAFADQYSYEIVSELATAMRDPSLANERFVIEGHASAEGSYEYNLALSQRRAERIVRDMVRQGVSPDRLIPVGYGESEAAYTENSAEQDRRFDRKVVVFRMNE